MLVLPHLTSLLVALGVAHAPTVEAQDVPTVQVAPLQGHTIHGHLPWVAEAQEDDDDVTGVAIARPPVRHAPTRVRPGRAIRRPTTSVDRRDRRPAIRRQARRTDSDEPPRL